MAESQNVQPKQKLSDEEKSKLINFYKDNRALWSSEVNFRNKEEKSVVKEDLIELFDGKFTEAFLDKNVHALRSAFNRESKKYKEKEPKNKWKFFEQLSFLTEEIEKVEKKGTFDFEEKEMLINFFNSKPALWNHHLTEYRDRNLRDSLLEKLVEQFDEKFSKEDIKREWHNLQTTYKREKAREDGSKVSGSGSCEVYISSWELFSEMEFLDVTGDVDTCYTSLDSEACAQPPKKIRKQSRTTENEAKVELWRSLAASLKPQQKAAKENTENNELSERAGLFGKVVADSLLQYDPKEWSFLKKKVMDVFYDFEQQKLAGHPSYHNTPFQPQQFQGNQFQPGPFFNMVNNASTSQNAQFDPFSPVSTCSNDS